MNKKILYMILLAILGSIGSRGSVKAILECKDIPTAIKCTFTSNCTWKGGTCLIKMPCDKRKLTQCTHADYEPLDCVWVPAGNGECMPMSKAPCEKKNEAYCNKDKKNCFMHKTTCYTKKYTKCEDVPEALCDDWASYLNCIWVGTLGTGKCLSKNSVKCSDLGQDNCDLRKYDYVKCQWLPNPVQRGAGKCAKKGFS